MMSDASLSGFAKSEVRLVVRGEERVLVSRLLAQRALLLVLLVLALLALVVPALDLRLDTVVLRCARDRAACTVSGGEAGGQTLRLSSILRFIARHPRKQKPDLLAQTGAGEVLLVHRWPHEELDRHADALNRLLRGEGPGEWAFTYGRRAQALREDLPIFGMLFALLVVLVGTQLGWRTRLDRRGRRVVRLKPLSRSVRPVGAFRAVRVRSMAEAYPATMGKQSREMDAVRQLHQQIALVEADGSAWPITRFVTLPREQLEMRAAEVAAYLNLPVERPEPLATVAVPAGR